MPTRNLTRTPSSKEISKQNGKDYIDLMERKMRYMEKKLETMENMLKIDMEEKLSHAKAQAQILDESNNDGNDLFSEQLENVPLSTGSENDLESGQHTGSVTASTVPDSQSCAGDLSHRTQDSANPFSPRAGRKLSWSKVNMILELKKNGKMLPPRKLLDNIKGEVPSKKITAIMGPSGGGKTSLLNILSGRASSKGPLTISSVIKLDQYRIDPTKIEVRKKIAFVAQEESLSPTATPREAISFSARLRLPRSTSDRDVEVLTSIMLTELGLDICADVIIGGGLIKGISGGQKKRASVGVELVVKPAMVFLDEPTSGLDSFSAGQLVRVLKKVAAAGASVLFTIHQPPSDVFNSFDYLILLKQGRVMYEGSIPEISTVFAANGSPVPPNFNPADWIIEVAQSNEIEDLERAGFFKPAKKSKRSKKLSLADKLKENIGFVETNGSNDGHVSPFTELVMLMTREIRGFSRNKFALAARFGVAIFCGILTGIMFWRIGLKDQNLQYLQNKFGAIIIVQLLAMFCTAQATLLEFPAERPIFVREYSTDHYSVTTYFIARLTMEAMITFSQIFMLTIVCHVMMAFRIPFLTFFLANYLIAMAGSAIAVVLGCAVEDPKLAQEALPVVFVPQMLFAGFFVLPELMPSWLRWCTSVCALTYSTRILLHGEFTRCADATYNLCKLMMDGIEIDATAIELYWLLLVILFIIFRAIALYLLMKKATAFF